MWQLKNKPMKKLIVLAFFSLLFLKLFAQENELKEWQFDEELNMNWSYKDLSQIIQSEFPEAYLEFMEISFIRLSKQIDPGTASFLIPTIKLKEITAEEFQKRIDNILLKMGNIAACPDYRVGESSRYSWTKWADKNVTKFYINFNIGC